MEKITRLVLAFAAVIAFSSGVNAFPIWNGSGAGGGGGTPGGSTGQSQYNAGSGNFGGYTMAGDCTLVTSTGAITCTKTGGTAFAASATTDTTNASNITSGTLSASALPAFTGDITTSAGSSATTLATVNSNVGVYNGITINAKGLNTAASFIASKASVRAVATGNLTATYSNGTAGVGATLTNSGTQTALVIDGVTTAVGNRVLVEGQSTNTQNGIYTVTNIGSGSTNWVLTRASDFDNSTAGNIYEGAEIPASEGTVNANAVFIENGQGPFTVGTTPITFGQNAAGSANSVVFSGITSGTNTSAAMVVGAGGSLNYSSSGTINASTLAGNAIGTSGATVPLLNGANTLSGANIVSTAGAASTPALSFSGNAYTAGSATTNYPLVYINNGASQPTTLSTAGTQLGFNATSGYTGLLLDAHVNGGASVFNVNYQGNILGATITGTTITASNKISDSYAGGASSAALQLTGALYTSGSGTTNFPQFFQQPAAATAVTTWSTSSTCYGINTASGFVGNFEDFRLNGGSSLFLVNYQGNLTAAGTGVFSGNVNAPQNYSNVQALTAGATVSWNANSGANATLSPGANTTFTLSNPTNLVAGGNYMITITQPASGSADVITWGSAYKFPAGTKFVLSTTNSYVDTIACYSPDATNLHCVGQAQFQ